MDKDKKLKIHGTLDGVLKVAFPQKVAPKPKKKTPKKKAKE